jgi:DNA repair exonuclease SbcCD ATPase subunit
MAGATIKTVANARRSYTIAEEIAMIAQVDRYCPLCGRSLFYEKKSRLHKEYELAHIYPLNPKSEEVVELRGVALLNADVNHPDNILPLCTSCHTRFDKPRTREEYEKLATLKRQLIAKVIQRGLNQEYPLEADINHIIRRPQADFERDHVAVRSPAERQIVTLVVGRNAGDAASHGVDHGGT